MNKLILLLAAIATIAGAACNDAKAPNVAKTPAVSTPAPVAADNHDEDAPRITLADAKKAFDAGEVVIIDTRSEAQFKAERIKGSINITRDSLEMRYKSIPTGKKIVAYCS